MVHETFYTTIKPLLITNKILGLVPFNFNENGYFSFKQYTFSIVLIVPIYVIFSIYVIFICMQMSRPTLTMVTDALEIFIVSSEIITVWITSVSFQRHHIKLVIKLEETAKKLQSLGGWIYFNQEQKLIRIQMLSHAIVIILSITIQSIIYRNHPFSIHCAFYFPLVINLALCQQVSAYIIMARKMFKILNEHLSRIEDCPDEMPEDIQKLKLVKVLKTKTSMIQTIANFHHDLSRTVYTINNIFGSPLLASFAITFIITIIDFYYAILIFQKLNYYTAQILLATLANCVPYIMDALLICYLCNSTSQEANSTGTLIHKLDNCNRNVSNQIQSFSLQLAHEKVEFNAAGFFPINYTLIFSIFGGVTTNLVILIQFSTS